jgi:hypothetical protein
MTWHHFTWGEILCEALRLFIAVIIGLLFGMAIYLVAL